jgi:hypothetical protein
MIWDKNISIEGYLSKLDEWYKDSNHFLGDPPIPAQYALDLIFKILIDDKEKYPYLTTMPENADQINSIKVDLILQKYSRKYRKYLRNRLKKRVKNE